MFIRVYPWFQRFKSPPQGAKSIKFKIQALIDFQIINFTRPEGGDNTSSISPTDNAVKLFMWKSIARNPHCRSGTI